MSPVATEPTAVIAKVRELCQAILDDPSYQVLVEKVEAFLDDDAAREDYRGTTELGQDLQQRQRMGEELTPASIREFESRRESTISNPLTRDFLDARRELDDLQRTLATWVEKTIELNRLPEEDELESGGGCCGGSCGCH
jgi:cell fate (sporulation/competence/biofilm development) regulator YlbF (YheA/YmcA/DUF963 family)